MKILNKITAASLLVVTLCSAVQAQEGPRGNRPQRPQPPQGQGQPRGHQPDAAILEKFDANKDGTLDETERAALHAAIKDGTVPPPPRGPGRGGRPPGGPGHNPEILAQYDANQDGKLDETERAAIKADIESGKLTPPQRPGGPRPHGGPDGEGRPAPSPEQEAFHQKVLAEYDANKDGKLDETERAAVKAAIDSGTLTPPARPEGRRGEGRPGRGGPRGPAPTN